MNRQIVYAGAIPLETDLLNTNKYAMLGLAKLASSLMGGNTYVHGLACTPSSPASMVVNVAAGQIYSLQNIDGTAYSSLPADTTHSILKQGYVLDAQQFTLTAPSTAGYSINYLIQVTYSDVDGGSTVLPYYNASNPSVAWNGPNNSGTAQYTVRQGICTVSLKAGVAATTGTQVTPTPDTGCTGLYVITVAQGATTVTAGNIVTYANAPFLPQGGIVAGIQQNSMKYAADTGVANAYAAQFTPAIPTLIDGVRVVFKAKTANTGPSTFAANGGSAYPLYSHAHQALQGGEIAVNGLVEVEWNSTLTAWVLCGNSGGSLPVLAGTQPNHAINLFQLQTRTPNQQTFTSSGSFTVPDGVTTLYLSGCAGGGGGGGGGGNPTTGSSGGGGGGGGAGNIAINQSVTVVPGQTYTVTIGARGNGGANSGLSSSDGKNGTAGGTTSFGSLLTLSGGGAGLGGVSGGNPSPGGGFGGAPGGSDGGDGNFTTAVATGNGGVGASGPFGVNGGRGRSGTPGRSGYAATGYGTGGGGGGGSYGSGGGIGAAGGNGSPGILIVRW